MVPLEQSLASQNTQLCACGCGTPTAHRSDRAKPNKYAFGHGPVKQPRDPRIPKGMCQCGCGQKTTIATMSDRRSGWLKGEPTLYVFGHQSRKSPVDYIEEDRGYKTPCWIWQRSIDDGGYGTVHIGRTTVRSHRHVYEKIKREKIPSGMELYHLCEVRPCVNPDHLEPVTNRENRRRSNVPTLNVEQVKEIRRRHEAGEKQIRLAEEFGVSSPAVSMIVNRIHWTDV